MELTDEQMTGMVWDVTLSSGRRVEVHVANIGESRWWWGLKVREPNLKVVDSVQGVSGRFEAAKRMAEVQLDDLRGRWGG